MFSELCSDTTLRNLVLVTNMWTTVSREAGEALEKELPTHLFKLPLGKGAQMARYIDTAQSAHDIIRRITKNYQVTRSIQRELVGGNKGITDTKAGEAVNRELNGQTGRQLDVPKKVEVDAMQALKEKNGDARNDLGEERKKMQEWMESMAAKYTAEKEKMEAKVIEMEREAKEERQRTDTELTNLSRRLQDAIDASAADRARLERVEAEHNRQLVYLSHRLQEVANASVVGQARPVQETREGKPRADAELADLARRLQDVTNASAADRAMLEQQVKERERAEADHKRQLADLTRRLQDEANASAAHRPRLEQEMKKLQDRVSTAANVPPPVPPRPVLCVQVFFSLSHSRWLMCFLQPPRHAEQSWCN